MGPLDVGVQMAPDRVRSHQRSVLVCVDVVVDIARSVAKSYMEFPGSRIVPNSGDVAGLNGLHFDGVGHFAPPFIGPNFVPILAMRHRRCRGDGGAGTKGGDAKGDGWG